MTDKAGRNVGEFIEAVELSELDKAIREKQIDRGSKQLKQAEQEYIRNWRKNRGEAEQTGEPDNLFGLALSGGGIRSATFSLGVMQALAHRGLLKKVDYLSTVSGGGYIGSALTWLLSRQAQQGTSASKDEHGGGNDNSETHFGLSKKDFPFGADDPDPDAERQDSHDQRSMLKYLRDHGYYLSPGKGITLASLLSVVLRGMVLNLIVWLPLFVLFFLVGLRGSDRLAQSVDYTQPPILTTILSDLKPHIGCSEEIPAAIVTAPPPVDAVCADIKSGKAFDFALGRGSELLGFELFLWIGGAILTVLLVGVVAYSLMTWFRRRSSSDKLRRAWYRARRRTERAAAILLPLVVVTLLVGTLPVVAVLLHGWLEAVGPAAMLSGILVAIPHFVKSTTSNSALPPGIAVTIGAGLFLYGVILVSYQAAFSWFPFMLEPAVVVLILISVPLITGWFVNLNYISIHRYYRDRLMESYMPDIDSALKNETGAAVGAGGARLHEVSDPRDPRGPYHIVNTNVVLVNSEDSTYRDRGGDNFVLSPLYCGSSATGWCMSKDFMGGKMTLPTAVAVSAAAVNPNTGVGGEGLTRNLFLSLVMSLLNLRIGYWATHPDPKKGSRHVPNHFRPGVYSFGNALGFEGLGFTEHRPYLQLSDGGHFENTGVYELVRRRMKLIIVCDGGADPDFSFSDFQTTIRRVEDDFGARLKVDEGATPDQIVPMPKQPSDGPCYPKDATFAKQGHMVGTLTYTDGITAKVIYLKTTLIEDVSFKVKGYAAQHPDFPDQSTADQFFDEVQFESYRELGYRIADQMLESRVPAPAPKPEPEQGEEKKLEEMIREFCGP